MDLADHRIFNWLADPADVFDIANVTLVSSAVRYIWGRNDLEMTRRMIRLEPDLSQRFVCVFLIDSIDDVNELIC